MRILGCVFDLFCLECTAKMHFPSDSLERTPHGYSRTQTTRTRINTRTEDVPRYCACHSCRRVVRGGRDGRRCSPAIGVRRRSPLSSRGPPSVNGSLNLRREKVAAGLCAYIVGACFSRRSSSLLKPESAIPSDCVKPFCGNGTVRSLSRRSTLRGARISGGGHHVR
jgi:hypothetical protein